MKHAGSQITSIRYGERLAELGAIPSIGSVGDSYDKALAESQSNLYNDKLVRNRGPWRDIDQLELATLEWVSWFNHTRFHSSLGISHPSSSKPPTTLSSPPASRWEANKSSLHQTQDGSALDC
jgi:putative transposase